MYRSTHVRGAVMLAVLVAASLTSAAQDTTSDANDVVTTARIETMFLMNGDLNPFKINTTTKDGVVTLTGVVQDQVDKDLAGRLAKTAKGVKSVNNELTVQRDVAVVKENAEWKQQIDDAALNANIRRRLAYHSGLKDSVLNIDVNGSTVMVSGEVDSEAEKKNVERVIDDTSGVSKVDSKITIASRQEPATTAKVEAKTEDAAETLSDEWVEKMVETSIMWNDNLSIRNIDVEVDDGVCTLTGTVISDAQKRLAGSVATNTDGVKSVTNNITVSGLAES